MEVPHDFVHQAVWETSSADSFIPTAQFHTTGSSSHEEDGGASGEGEKTSRQYMVGEVLSRLEEDQTHEFKGHRSISVHDIHNICLGGHGSGERTRSAVSNTIGAMLNSGQGGTIYLGVNDNGLVRGLALTRYQQDHIEASVEWTVGRYTPPVPDSHYCVTFVPALASRTQPLPSLTTHQSVDSSRRGRPHHVAQPHYCWCDHDAAAQISLGKAPMLYVVEIHVRPWDPHHHHVFSSPLGAAAPPIPPLHLTEANICYIRQTCRQPALCLDDVRRLLVHRVEEHYKLKLAALHHQAKMLRGLARVHGVQLGHNNNTGSGQEGRGRREASGRSGE